jgi:hypothetical protein
MNKAFIIVNYLVLTIAALGKINAMSINQQEQDSTQALESPLSDQNSRGQHKLANLSIGRKFIDFLKHNYRFELVERINNVTANIHILHYKLLRRNKKHIYYTDTGIHVLLTIKVLADGGFSIIIQHREQKQWLYHDHFWHDVCSPIESVSSAITRNLKKELMLIVLFTRAYQSSQYSVTCDQCPELICSLLPSKPPIFALCITLLPCGHIFHTRCIPSDNRMYQTKTCPCCHKSTRISNLLNTRCYYEDLTIENYLSW